MSGLESGSSELVIRGMVVSLYPSSPELADTVAGVVQIGKSLGDLATESMKGDMVQASLAAASAAYTCYLVTS